MIKEQLSDEPLQGGEAGNGTVAPYGQRARVTPERLAFVIREQWKSFNQVQTNVLPLLCCPVPSVNGMPFLLEQFSFSCFGRCSHHLERKCRDLPQGNI